MSDDRSDGTGSDPAADVRTRDDRAPRPHPPEEGQQRARRARTRSGRDLDLDRRLQALGYLAMGYRTRTDSDAKRADPLGLGSGPSWITTIE